MASDKGIYSTIYVYFSEVLFIAFIVYNNIIILCYNILCHEIIVASGEK